MSGVLRALTASLPEQHRRALEWFDDHAGRVVGWPGRLEDGTLLANKAKGIYKPAWSSYALSVRQSLNGPYPDRPVENRTDGSWLFEYFQESLDQDQFDAQFTNRGLIECMKDVIPVGVFIQVTPKPRSTYRILGLALVTAFAEGYFSFEGEQSDWVRDRPQPLLPAVGDSIGQRADFVAHAFDPKQVVDERKRVIQSINVRRGQAGFRNLLLDAYGRRCALSGYDANEALEAAHIVPYRGPTTNHPTNGLLLRADIHSLFDLGLMSVDYDSRRILLHPELKKTKYVPLGSALIEFPTDPRYHPSRDAIAIHREYARSKGLA